MKFYFTLVKTPEGTLPVIYTKDEEGHRKLFEVGPRVYGGRLGAEAWVQTRLELLMKAAEALGC